MRRAAVIAVAALAGAWIIVVVIQSRTRDPETSNPADLAYEKQTAGRLDASQGEPDGDEPPDFFVSDDKLLVKTEHEVREQITDEATGKGVADAPYFIELAGGRFAFGYADAEGRTRPLFTPTKQKFAVYWYDDAWERWNKRRKRSTTPGGDAAQAAPTANPK
jgi:hypothetical protein